MNIVQSAARAVTRAADATAAAAGSVGGAAVSGVVGGIKGAATGLRDGFSSGSRSTPAAALTFAAIGAAGLVEWPVLLGIGGTALVVHQLNQRARNDDQPALRAVGSPNGKEPSTRPAARAPKAPARPSKSAARTTKAPARKSARQRPAPDA